MKLDFVLFLAGVCAVPKIGPSTFLCRRQAKSDVLFSVQKHDIILTFPIAAYSVQPLDDTLQAAEAVARARDEALLTASAASQRAQQERDGLAEVEGENDGLRARLQLMEEEIAALATEADHVRPFVIRSWG